MARKLNQLLAIEKQVKTNTQKQLTGVYQLVQKDALTKGMSRTYRPLDDDGEKFPDEVQRVQVRVPEQLQEISRVCSELFDVTLARDTANCSAKADVVVDDQTILEQVPATYLLWLEKQLTDLHTVIVNLPTLPPEHDWSFDNAQDCYRSKSSERGKTKKVPKPIVLAPATKEHPAQVQLGNEDVLVGYWTQTEFSGALPMKDAQALRGRIEKLMAAVKMAREQANLVEAPKAVASDKIFGYLFPKN